MYGFEIRLQDVGVYLEYEKSHDGSEIVLMSIYSGGDDNIIDIVSDDFRAECETASIEEAYQEGVLRN